MIPRYFEVHFTSHTHKCFLKFFFKNTIELPNEQNDEDKRLKERPFVEQSNCSKNELTHINCLRAVVKLKREALVISYPIRYQRSSVKNKGLKMW